MADEQVKTEETKADLSKKAQKVIEEIQNMTVLELADLVKALEDKFGVSAAMPVMAAGMGMPGAAGAAGAAAAAEEKTTFTVVLAAAGAQKIQVIKEIRAITNLGLKEAKDLVDGAPKTVKEDATKDEAEAIKAKLVAVGATVELK